jgi:hypothetical protein
MAVELRLMFGLPIVDIDVGVMDYGVDIQGILGFDFIREAKLVIDTVRMQVYTAK